MKKQIDSLTSLAVHARDYVKRTGIQPVEKYIDFRDGLVAYCTEDYAFFSLSYDHDTKVVVHTYNGNKNTVSITFNADTTAEHLEAIYAKAFETIFQYEQQSTEILEQQKLAQIAELESKLARLRDL